METKKNIEKAVLDTYKNAQIALHSLNAIIPTVQDKGLLNELKEEYDGYDKVKKEISSFLSQNKIEKKKINPIKKAMLWTSIKMKTAMNNSKNQIAEMMINGTVMGINELRAMVNEKENYPEDVTALIEKLLQLEEQYERNLKQYL